MKNFEKVFFSIIIPVYNVKEYLEMCVDSVLHQDFDNYEIILVDDGSFDNSGDICDRYANCNDHVHVIHQSNQGLSAARNTGFSQAVGEYVLFLDGDDFYPQNNFLTLLHSQCCHCDIVCFNYARYTDKLLSNMISFGTTETVVTKELLVQRNAYTSSACFKAIKRKLLSDNNICFEVGALSEDVEWSARVLYCAQSIAVASDCIYAYRIRPGSISRSISLKHTKKLQEIVTQLANKYSNETDSSSKTVLHYTAFQYCTLLINMHLCKPKLDKSSRKDIQKLTWLLDYNSNKIVKLVSLFYHIFGFSITSYLLYIYFTIFYK